MAKLTVLILKRRYAYSNYHSGFHKHHIMDPNEKDITLCKKDLFFLGLDQRFDSSEKIRSKILTLNKKNLCKECRALAIGFFKRKSTKEADLKRRRELLRERNFNRIEYED